MQIGWTDGHTIWLSAWPTEYLHSAFIREISQQKTQLQPFLQGITNII